MLSISVTLTTNGQGVLEHATSGDGGDLRGRCRTVEQGPVFYNTVHTSYMLLRSWGKYVLCLASNKHSSMLPEHMKNHEMNRSNQLSW